MRSNAYFICKLSICKKSKSTDENVENKKEVKDLWKKNIAGPGNAILPIIDIFVRNIRSDSIHED